MHGANRTGRPFHGDHAGILLYDTLRTFRFCEQPTAEAMAKGIRLYDCRITNAVKCLPPGNLPTASEVGTCRRYLVGELALMRRLKVVVALGGVAHKAIVRVYGGHQQDYPFSHAGEHIMDNAVTLLDSYHCSRYNTNTGRLTPAMFRQVFSRARELVDAHAQ